MASKNVFTNTSLDDLCSRLEQVSGRLSTSQKPPFITGVNTFKKEWKKKDPDIEKLMRSTDTIKRHLKDAAHQRLKEEVNNYEKYAKDKNERKVTPPPNPKGTYKAKLQVDTEPEADCVPGRATRKDNNNSNAEKETSSSLYGKHDAQLQAIVIEMQKLGEQQGLKMEHKPSGSQDADTSITHINNMLEHLLRQNPVANKPDKKVDKGRKVKLVEVEENLMEDLREAIKSLQKDMTDWESVTEPVLNKKGKPKAEPEPEGIVRDVLKMKIELNKRKLQCKTEAERLTKVQDEIQNLKKDMEAWDNVVTEASPKMQRKKNTSPESQPEDDAVIGDLLKMRKELNTRKKQCRDDNDRMAKLKTEIQQLDDDMGVWEHIAVETPPNPNGKAKKNMDTDPEDAGIVGQVMRMGRALNKRKQQSKDEKNRMAKLKKEIQQLDDDMGVWEHIAVETPPNPNGKAKKNMDTDPEDAGIVGQVMRMRRALNKRKQQSKDEKNRLIVLEKEIEALNTVIMSLENDVVHWDDCSQVNIDYQPQNALTEEMLKTLAELRKEVYNRKNGSSKMEASLKQDYVLKEIVIDSLKDLYYSLTRNELKYGGNSLREMSQELLDSCCSIGLTRENIKDMKYTIRELNGTVEGLQKEGDDLKMRLSKMAEDRLRDNNPDIADLSDVKRPTKLAESFSTLFDDGWTDAFDDLTKNKEYELVVISKLLDILKEAYEFCKHVSGRQLEMLTDFAVNPASCVHSNGSSDRNPKKQKADTKIPSKISTAIGDLRKGGSTISFSNILEVSKSKAALSPVEPRTLREYTERCLELCWYMTLQAPPVVIDFTVTRGDRFDTGKYRSYTKSGKKVDFVVWPVLLLHEGGAVLGKGVAQGK